MWLQGFVSKQTEQTAIDCDGEGYRKQTNKKQITSIGVGMTLKFKF